MNHPDGLIPPEGTNAPAPARSKAQAQIVKTRNAVLAALGLPDATGLPSLDTLVTSVLGQRAQDRAFWLMHYFLALYFLGHQLFRVFPCSSSAQLDALREFAVEMQQEQGQAGQGAKE